MTLRQERIGMTFSGLKPELLGELLVGWGDGS